MPYRLDPNTGQFVWDGSSIPQTTRDSLGTQIRDLQDQIDNFGFVDLNDAPASYTGQAGKVVAVKSTEDGVEFITNTGGSGSGDVTGPASSTDNAIARFDSTTGKIIQNSSATVSDVGGVSADTFTLSATPTGAGGTGVLRYDSGEKVAEIGIDGITLKIGTQEYVRVYNATASTLTKGQVVYISGAQGNRVAVQLADASSESTSAGTLGIVAQSITSGAEGFVQTAGSMYSLNTLGLTAGALLYLSETAGEWTATEPAAPAHGVRLAYVERVSSTVGSIYIKVDNGYELGELHNVTDSVTGATAFLVKNSSTNVWESKNASDSRSALGLGTLATQDGTFSGTSSGTNTGDQNTFSTIAVSGQSNVVADSTSDTLTLAAGSGVTITTNATTDTITISSTATGGGTNTIMRLFPKDNEPPTSGFATLDTRNSHPVLDFADTGTETAIFRTYLPQGATFAGSGTALTVYIDAAATSATSGVVGWSVSLERLVAGGQDLDADNWGTVLSGSQTISSTSGVMCRTTVTFMQSQLPANLAAGDMFRIRIQRNTSVGSNHTGDAEFVGAYLEITPSTP